MQNSHITLTCAALVNHNSLRKDEHGVEANGVTWHCTALMHERTAQKSAKTRNICISAPSAAAVIYFSTAESLFLLNT